MTNQITLVTGASRGIGQAIALRLAGAGDFVIGTATTEEGAEAISSSFEQAGLPGVGLRLDVTETASIDIFIKKITTEYGAPTTVVNNAAITRDNLLMRMKDDEWGSVMQTNLNAIFKLSKACLRGMMKVRYGRIVSITSVVAATGNQGQTNYCAAKAGVIGFTKALAKEVGSRNITVNTVSPGFIDTDMTSGLPEPHKEALLAAIPLNRLGLPEDVANAVAFLCSPEAAYITGETVHVNGGMFMA